MLGAGLTVASLALGCLRAPVAEPPEEAPRLILLIVVDQLGGEHLERFDEALEGGFRRLLDEGFSFREAHHAHADTSTGPGHATIATGAHPSSHGVVGNYWTDRDTGDRVYCVGDSDHGRSPRRLIGSALGDWLKARYPASKVFSLSGKDRSAILLGGRAPDGAYWYGWDGTFESSSYYREPEPFWLQQVNAEDFFGSRYGELWTPLPFDAEALARMGVADRDLGPLEQDFPHTTGWLSPAPGDSFFDQVFDAPVMDQFMLRLARAAIEGEELGADRFPDLLALGFSTLDSVGHSYGPDSREFFDALVRLDRELGSFFDWLDETVGMDRVAIALSSDHGSVPVPEFRREDGLPGKRAGAAEIACLQGLDRALDREFGAAEWFRPGPFLEPDAPELAVPASRLRERVRELVESCPSVSRVWLAEDLAPGAEPGGAMQQRYARNFFPGRSPDFEIQWDEYFLSSRRSASSHGTPYRYDTHVPLVLYGPGGRAGASDEPVWTVDIAPTLAAWAGVAPPEAVDGRSLADLVGKRAGASL